MRVDQYVVLYLFSMIPIQEILGVECHVELFFVMQILREVDLVDSWK